MVGIFTFILITTFLGCSKLEFFSTVFAPQEWSDNYALLEGATCNAPLMIDGKRETVGKTGREITIDLPKRKSIHRVVIRDTNIEDVVLYRWTGNKWMKAKKIVNNTSDTIEMRVGIATSRVRFRIGGTSDDERLPGQPSPITGRIIRNRIKPANPIASEIELYGFVSKSDKEKEEEMLF